ncbi:DUF3152 domain-containing protein [Nocardioides dongxiaopingii]|nr:DUF3152 domain-containing protein [Nocardioides sp. S-1144]
MDAVRPLLLVLTAVASLVVPVTVAVPTGAAGAAGPAAVVSTSPPTVTGDPVFGQPLRADPGTWDPADVTPAYRWLRDGQPVRGARERTYRPRLADLGHRLSVRVVATSADGSRGTAESARTTRVRRAELVNRRPPSVSGDARFGRTLTARPGRWSTTPTRLTHEWLRGRTPIAGATGERHEVAPDDVGRRLRVRVTASAPGYRPSTAVSDAVLGQHRLDVRRTVTYTVRTRGRITASLAEFRRQAQETFTDPRGWRGRGVRFRPVADGGSFTLVLAEASTVPSFSSACSVEWSCRVGRYVIINQTRWRTASPAWNRSRLSRRDYRHMVVNHETGHWLGRGHASCPRPGALAPVMMQQSKGTGGCRFNPWPTESELR